MLSRGTEPIARDHIDFQMSDLDNLHDPEKIDPEIIENIEAGF
jgi:hypothetical protein